MNDHLRYEELTALAAAGYLSDDESRELLDHMVLCDQCRTAERAFRDIVRCLWPTRSQLHEIVDKWEEENLRARFLERAQREGIKFSRDVPQRKKSS